MASDLDALRPLLKTRIDALSLGGAPISYQGQNFAIPNGKWVRVTVRWGRGQMVTGGSGVTGNHVTGVLILDVFDVPRGGLAAIEAIADTLRTSFSRVTVGAAYFFAPSGPEVIEDASQDKAAKWNHVQVQCPFELVEA